MTQKQKIYKASLVKAIHISKLYIDIYSKDRELYEDMLFNNFVIKSSKNLSIDELKRLVLFLGGSSTTSLKVKLINNQALFLLTLWREKSRLIKMKITFKYDL